MKLHEQPKSLDAQMIGRYGDVTRSHPSSPMVVPMSDTPDCHTNFQRMIHGELVHVMVAKGPLLLVTWVPSSPTLRFIFDAYSQ